MLIGNNIVNILASAMATLLFAKLIANQDLAATVSTAVLTIVILVFGEISPKSLAKEMPERFAMLVTPVIRLLMALLKPVNWLFSQWKLLLHKQEIRKLDGLVARQGYTLIPLEVYLKDGRMKLQLGLCKGKAEHDKRDSIAKRDAERDIRRAIRENNK